MSPRHNTLPSHKEDCPCPACRARRGERPAKGRVLRLYLSRINSDTLDALGEMWQLTPGQVIGRLLQRSKAGGG